MADVYDRQAAPYHAAMETELLRLADPRPKERVLDLGCGSGNLALAAASRVGPAGAVLSIDLAAGMVRVAAAKAAQSEVGHVRFKVIDARALGLPDASFDVAVSCLGVPSIGHTQCFSEVCRVLTKGGRFVFSEGTGKGSEVGRAFHDLLAKHRPREPSPAVRRLLDARRCLMESGQPKEVRDPAAVRSNLKRIGFREVRFTRRVHPLVYPTADAYLARGASWGDNERELRAMGAERRRRFRNEFAKRIARFRTDNGFTAAQENLYVTARK